MNEGNGSPYLTPILTVKRYATANKLPKRFVLQKYLFLETIGMNEFIFVLKFVAVKLAFWKCKFHIWFA